MKSTAFLVILFSFFSGHVTAQEQAMTYGWEVEFSAGDHVKKNELASFEDRSPGQDDLDQSHVTTNIKKYPFLTPKGVIEPEGNIEITSTPFSSIPETFKALRLVKNI
jgi:hypothetical protein